MLFKAFKPSEDWGWVTYMLDIPLSTDMRGIVAVQDGVRKGVVLLENWTHNGCVAHFAATTPMVWRHGLHVEAFKYVFETNGMDFMLGYIPASNRESWRLAEHMGLREVYRIRDGFAPGDDMVMYELRKADCHYLGKHDEQEHSRAA